jgi:AAA domain
MKLFTAEERLTESRGANILLLGRPGVGKTSMLRTLGSTALGSTLFVDCEGGDLSVLGLPVASIRPGTWGDLRNLAVLFGGADPSRPRSATYGSDHYQSVIINPMLAPLADFRTIFIDSLTQAMRLCHAWAETQPEAFIERGRKDPRGMFGLIALEGVSFLQQFQRDRSRNIIFVCDRHAPSRRSHALPKSSPQPSKRDCSSAPTLTRATFAVSHSAATGIAVGACHERYSKELRTETRRPCPHARH